MAINLQQPAQPVAAPPAVAPQVQGAGTPDAAKPKKERKTAKDFATWADFCDFKIKEYEGMAARVATKIALWTKKKTDGKGAMDADTEAKKIEKMQAALNALLAAKAAREAARAGKPTT